MKHQSNTNPGRRHKAPHKAAWIPVMIVLVGAMLRLGAFQEALVGADQSSILAAAADIAAMRDFPGVGIKSSVGVMQTATTAYLAALPLMLVHRVIAIKWFFSVLDILAIAVLYRAVRDTFGRRAAAVAGLLYATNPWIVEFNRWIWYQTLIPTFATLAFAALLPTTARTGKQHPAFIAAAMVSATLMGLVHLAAVPWAILLCALSLAIAVLNRWWRPLVLGIAGCLIVASPYIGYLLQGGIADVEMILSGTHEAEHSPGLNTSAYRLSGELLTGRQVLETPRNSLWAESIFEPELMYWIIPIVLGIAAIWALVAFVTRRHRHPWALAFTLAWTVLAPTSFILSDVHLQHFYLLFIFPAPFVLIGAALETGAPSCRPTPNRAVRATVWGAVGSLLLLSLWWTHLWVIRIGYEQQGRLRAPTRAWIMDKTAEQIDGYLNQNPTAEVIILTHFGGEATPFDWIRNFVGSDRVRVTPAEGGLIIPASETCYMLAEEATSEPLIPLGDTVTLQPEMTLPASPPWTFYCASSRPQLPTPQATWQNGLSLLETKTIGDFEAGGQLRLVNTWHYDMVTDREYHFFNHLMTGDNLTAQVDGAGIPTRYWRDDDVFITEFTLVIPEELPPEEYKLRVGVYTWPEIERINLVTGEDAQVTARWVVK